MWKRSDPGRDDRTSFVRRVTMTVIAAILSLLGLASVAQWKGSFEYVSPDGTLIRFEAEASRSKPPP
jgi:hypothetical protein